MSPGVVHRTNSLRVSRSVARPKAPTMSAEVERRRLAHTPRWHRLITICAWCNQIRDREGRWRQLEADFGAGRGAKYSHGICPECATESYNAYQAGMSALTAC